MNIQEILNSINNQQTEINEYNLINSLTKCDISYFNESDHLISDEQYDTLYKYTKDLYSTNTYFSKVGSSIRGGKVKLPHTMGSLNQLFVGEVAPFIKKHKLTNEVAVISDKLDGNSAMLLYEFGKFKIGFSRGDGFEGADISRHIVKLPSVPKQIPLADKISIRGENIISKNNFVNNIVGKVSTRNNKDYKNPRNCVSGLMNAEVNDPIVYNSIEFIAYEIVDSDLSKIEQLELLKSLGFLVVNYRTDTFINLTDEVLTETTFESKQLSQYELDGIVVEVENSKLRKQISPTKETLNPEHTFKFKVSTEDNIATTTILDVELNISKDGFIKPRVRFEPIELLGATVQYATAHNMKFIFDNKLCPGAKIKITRSGEVIPSIVNIEDSDPIKFEEWVSYVLSDLDCRWSTSGIDLILKSKGNNMDIKLERMKHFFETIKISNLGDGIVANLFDVGIDTPETVLNLTLQDWVGIIGDKNGKKIHKNLVARLSNIYEYELMASFDLDRGIGVRKCKALWNAFNGDMSKCNNVALIESVPGFDTKSSTKIIEGYPEYLEFMSKIKHLITLIPYTEAVEGVFTPHTICFTGIRSKNMEKKIESMGGKVTTSVSANTTILVTDDVNSNSSKTNAARKLGIPIITLEQLMAM